MSSSARSRAAQRSRRALLETSALALAAALGCNRSTSPPGPSSSAGNPSTAAIRAGAGPSTLALLADLELEPLRQDLGCATVARPILNAAACSILNDFGQAETPTSFPPIGQAAWYGRAHVIRNRRIEAKDYYHLRCRPGRGRTVQASKAVMEYSVAFGTALPGGGEKDDEAEALVRSLGSGQAPQGEFARELKQSRPEAAFRGLVRTEGPSLYFADSGRDLYLRESRGRWLLIVRQPAEASLAELWPVP